MAGKLETDIVINLAGNLASKAKRYGNSMSEFARKNERSMKMVRMSTNAAGRGIDRLGNRYVGLGSALLTGAAVRGVGNFEEQMTRIGTNAKLSDEQVKALTQSVEDVSNNSNVRVDTTQLAAGVDALLGKTGDIEFTMDNLENMGVFMQAFGADAQSTGALFAQFREKGVKDSQAVMKVIDQLYGQFAIGSVSVKDLAGISEQLFATYQSKGPGAVTQMGALVQLFAKSKGNANEALTSIQGVFATFADKKKVEFLDKQGINVFKKGTTELREPVELLLEVLDKAKNDPLKLGDVFDQTSLQGLASLYGAENKQLLKDMVSGSAELGATQKAAAKNAATFNSAITSLQNSASKFANEELAEPIKAIADAINGVDQETIDNWLKWGEVAAIAVGGVIVAKKALDAGMWAKKTFGAGGLGKGGKGGIQSLGATPVYVVNMGKGGLGGLDALPGKGKGKSALVKGAAALLSRAAVIPSALLYSGSLNSGEDEFMDKLHSQQPKDNSGRSYVPSLVPDLNITQSSNLFESEQKRKSLAKLVDGLGLNKNGSPYVSPLGHRPSNQGNNSAPENSMIGMDINVYDHRIEKKIVSKSPNISIQSDPDAGIN